MDKRKTWRAVKRFGPKLVILLLAGFFFLATAAFNYRTQDGNFVKWLSPDETANYVFAKYYGQEGDMRIFERYNLYAGDLMHPRSFRSDAGKLKPVSFLGIILLYGTVVKLGTYKILPYITPAVGAIGLVFFFLLVRRLFGRPAWLAVFLLAVFPPYVYYSARSMFHNVLFVVLVIIGLYFSTFMPAGRKAGKAAPPGSPKVKNKAGSEAKIKRMALAARKAGARFFAWPRKNDFIRLAAAFSAGGAFGLAVGVRASELLWLGPLMAVLWLGYCHRIGPGKLLIFLAGAGLALLPVGYWNTVLYGNPYFGGYPEMNATIVNVSQATGELAAATAGARLDEIRSVGRALRDEIFFFGLSFAGSAKMLYHYFAFMFPWLFSGAILGAIIFYSRRRYVKKKHIFYLFGLILVSAILVFYYGSWGFHDNPDPGSYTIGNSYTRYWLPVYLGVLPFFCYLIIYLTRLIFPRRFFKAKNSQGGDRWWKKEKARKAFITSLRAAVVIVIGVFSLRFVLIGSDEGLLFAARRQREAKSEWEKVLALTEKNAVIITKYHDKLFFPERKVIHGLFDDPNMIAVYARIVNRLPTYYYNFTFPENDFAYLNERRLKEFGLELEVVERVTGDFTLYKITGRIPGDN